MTAVTRDCPMCRLFADDAGQPRAHTLPDLECKARALLCHSCGSTSWWHGIRHPHVAIAPEVPPCAGFVAQQALVFSPGAQVFVLPYHCPGTVLEALHTSAYRGGLYYVQGPDNGVSFTTRALYGDELRLRAEHEAERSET